MRIGRRQVAVAAASVVACVAGVASALVVTGTAFAHSNPCHSQHSCPSDHHTYIWYNPSGNGWDCVEPGASEYNPAVDTTTIVYAGLTYYCHAAGATPPTATAPTTTVSSPMTDPYLNGFVEATNTRQVALWTLCFAASGATLTSGVLDFGDGNQTTVGASASDLEHQYAYAGTYTVTLTCADSAGNQKSVTSSFTVTGPSKTPPVTTTTTVVTTPKPKPKPTGRVFRRRDGEARRSLAVSHCTRGALPDRQCSPARSTKV